MSEISSPLIIPLFLRTVSLVTRLWLTVLAVSIIASAFNVFPTLRSSCIEWQTSQRLISLAAIIDITAIQEHQEIVDSVIRATHTVLPVTAANV